MRKALPLILTVLVLAGCNVVYRQPVFQGNLLDQKNVEQLKEGLSHQQVFILLGSPSIQDPFHKQRWDYASTQRRLRNATEIKVLTLWFEADKLVRWEGEYFPEQDAALAKEMGKFGNLRKEKPKQGGQ